MTGAQASDLLEAELIATTLNAILQEGPIDDESLATNSLAVAKLANEAIEVMCYIYFELRVSHRIFSKLMIFIIGIGGVVDWL